MQRISLKRLADLCHRVGTSYQAGIDVLTIWKREAGAGSPHHRREMERVAGRIGEGGTVAEGMRATEGYFPELTCSITEAGEVSGRLERAFQLLADHYDTVLRFRREMTGRLAWPVFELVMAVVIIALMILGIGWASTANASGESFDFIGWGWTTAQYFWGWILFCTTFFGGAALVIYGTLAGWFGTLPMRLARRLPVLGKTIEVMSLSRFAWVLAAVYEAGMNTMHGVALALRSTQNFYYADQEKPVVDDLQNGVDLALALRKTGVFPDDLILYVENGELTGQVPESMNRLADQYQAEAEKNLALISKIVFFVVFSTIAIMIAFVVISLYSRYIHNVMEFAN